MTDYSFPRLRFADENTEALQVEHIYSEALEVLRAAPGAERDLEVADVMQACATYFEIRRKAGVDPAEVCRLRDLKNKKRGY
jgi:hypothetical protein